MSDFGIILVTALVASVICGFVGLHLIVRRQAMMSDALSHSVLPGLVLAYLVFGSLGPGAMFLGAMLTALVMGFSLEAIRQQKLLREDAATGLVFATLFALGVLLLKTKAHDVHLDTQCVLFGELAFVPLETSHAFLGTWPLPESLHHMIWVGALVICMGLVFHKELLISAFHEEMARTIGLPTRFIQYMLIMCAAAVIMACFRSLGAILVIAFLVLPGAFGMLFSKSYFSILGIGLVINAVGIALGTWLAFQLENNVGSMIVSVNFLIFTVLAASKQLRRSRKAQQVH